MIGNGKSDLCSQNNWKIETVSDTTLGKGMHEVTELEREEKTLHIICKLTETVPDEKRC